MPSRAGRSQSLDCHYAENYNPGACAEQPAAPERLQQGADPSRVNVICLLTTPDPVPVQSNMLPLSDFNKEWTPQG